MSSKSKIAVWGLGKHAINNILPAIQESSKLELVGCYTRNGRILESICKRYSIKSWVTEDEMLNDSYVDIIYLSTPPELHYTQGLQILESNKHLWCEKPISNNLQSTIDLVQLANKKSLSVCEGFMYLYHPHFQAFNEFITHLELSEKIFSIKSSFFLPKLEKPGFRFNKELGGSCIYDVGVYPISLITELFKDREITINHSNISEEENVDVSGSANISIDQSIDCYLEWSYNSTYINRVEIQSESKNIKTDYIFSKKENYQPIIEIINAHGDYEEVTIKARNHFMLMLESFTKCLDNQSERLAQEKRILRIAKLVNRIRSF
ncbi:MAG: hypothetical protein CL402_11680 [Acidiferrobacteraceae bacterium]|nr:hypothetical protein [Acidiferrobacteraceae bacterium]